MNIFEALMLIALLGLPVLLGALVGRAGRPWWLAAGIAIVLFNIAAIAPPTEPGEPRVAGDDLVFLAMCSVVVAGLTALGYWLSRRVRRAEQRRVHP